MDHKFVAENLGVSVPISVNDLFWRNEITLTSSYAGSPADYAAVLELIQAGKMRVWEMIIHRLGLAETGHFYLSLRAKCGASFPRHPHRDCFVPIASGLAKT